MLLLQLNLHSKLSKGSIPVMAGRSCLLTQQSPTRMEILRRLSFSLALIRPLSRGLPCSCAKSLSKLVRKCILTMTSLTGNRREWFKLYLMARKSILRKCFLHPQMSTRQWCDGKSPLWANSIKRKSFLFLRHLSLTQSMQQSGVFNTFFPCAPGGHRKTSFAIATWNCRTLFCGDNRLFNRKFHMLEKHKKPRHCLPAGN